MITYDYGHCNLIFNANNNMNIYGDCIHGKVDEYYSGYDYHCIYEIYKVGLSFVAKIKHIYDGKGKIYIYELKKNNNDSYMETKEACFMDCYTYHKNIYKSYAEETHKKDMEKLNMIIKTKEIK
jgi:hypothetical protein